MPITPLPPKAVTAPNTIPAKSEAGPSNPNTITPVAAGDVALPNTDITPKTAVNPSVPNSVG